MRNGIYRTLDNNTAYVPSPTSTRAFDLTQREWVPITEVRERFYLRPAEAEDRRLAASSRYYAERHTGLL